MTHGDTPAGPRRPSWVRIAVGAVLMLAAFEYGVLPFLVTARHDLQLVGRVAVPVLAAALTLEVGAVLSYTLLTQAHRFPAPTDSVGGPSCASTSRASVPAMCFPGGGATAAALRYQMMTEAGVDRTRAVTAEALQATVSDLALVCCYGLGALLAVNEVLQHPVLVVTVVVGLAALGAVPMEGWMRGDWYDSTSLPWINPSPNLRSLTEATLYPGVALVEFTNVSVGRGTDTPFELLGAPWIKGRNWRNT